MSSSTRRRVLLVRSVPATVAAALLASTAGAVLLAAPATAKVETHVDATGDAQRKTASTTRVDPQNKHADIVKLVTNHTTASVVVRATLRMVAPSTRLEVHRLVNLRTPSTTYVVGYRYTPGVGAAVAMGTIGGQTVDCDGLRYRTTVASNTFAVTVPRSCLGNPAWVRTGLYTETIDQAGQMLWRDDARRKNAVDVSHIALGPKVYRG